MADEYDVVFDRESLLPTNNPPVQQKNKHRKLTTFCLCAAFFSLGLCIALPGPTLLDLEVNTHTNASQIVSIFTSRSVGYLLGSVFGGCLFDRVNQSLLLSVVLLLTALMTAFFPLSHTLVVLVVLILFQGASMGFLDTGGNVALLHTWGQESAPYMQAIHFSFGLGAFVAPLIAEILLLKSDSDALVSFSSATNLTANSSLSTANLPFVMYSYVIVSALLAVVGIAFLCLWSCTDKCSRQPSSVESTIRSEFTVRKERKLFRVQLLLLLSAFYFLYVGMEVTYGALIVEFAVERLHWNKVSATWLNSVFWGTFALARGISIPAAHCLKPATLLTIDLILTTVALVGLVAGNFVIPASLTIAGIHAYDLVVWVCTAALGVGFSSIFPAGISWAERYVRMTGKATAVFVVGSALGEMVIPYATGNLIASRNAMWLMYVELFAVSVSVVLFIAMSLLACSAGERYQLLTALNEDSRPLQSSVGGTGDDDDDDDNNIADNNHSSHGKKHVTFDLISAPSSSLTRASANSKSSILKLKSTVKKD